MPAWTRTRPVVTSGLTLLALGLVATAAAPSLIRVQRGDTLSGLAVRYGTTVSALQAANGLHGDLILAGSTLTLPSTRTATTTSATVEHTHVVVLGETVTSIAQQAGTSVAAVLARNGLSSASLIRPGQSLVVPVTTRTVTGSSSPTTTTTHVPATVSSSAARDRALLATRPVLSTSQVRSLVAATARQYGVPVPLALAISYQESGFQQRVVSGVDAVGAMQVLPSTARTLSAQIGRSLDLLDTRDNVTAGVLVLRQLLRSQPTTDAAIAGYYQGVGAIASQGVLPQTVQYIASVHALQARFANG